MKYIFYIVPILLTCVFAYGQDSINQRDDKNLKQGPWIFYGKDRPESGIPFDGKVEEGNYINDRKEGLWIKYHDDGVTPKMVGYYTNNRPDSTYWKYHTNGVLKEKGCFKKNNWRDSLVRYYDCGVVEYEAFYDSIGKENGWVRYYFKDGTKEYEYFTNHGVPVGKAIRFQKEDDTLIAYDKYGDKISTVHKEENHQPCLAPEPNTAHKYPPDPNKHSGDPGKWNPNDYNKVFNEDKDIWQDGTFKDGKLWDGKVYIYDKDGILLGVKIYKNGVYYSEGRL